MKLVFWFLMCCRSVSAHANTGLLLFGEDFLCKLRDKPVSYQFTTVEPENPISPLFRDAFLPKYVRRLDVEELQKTGAFPLPSDTHFRMNCSLSHEGFQCRTLLREIFQLRPILLMLPVEAFALSKTSDHPDYDVSVEGKLFYRIEHPGWKRKAVDEGLIVDCHFTKRQLQPAPQSVLSGRIT